MSKLKTTTQNSKLNPPAGGQNHPVAVIPELNSGQALTKVRICLILNQVQNDANRGCHSDDPPAGGLKLNSLIRVNSCVYSCSFVYH